MSDTHTSVMGEKGRVVVPVEIREHAGLEPGTPLVFIDTGDGVVMLTRSQALARVRAQLDGTQLVDELLTERRAAAAEESA